MEKPKVLVSACLLGWNCRYDGRSKPCPEVKRLEKFAEIVPVCPESAGGLRIPRPPSEKLGGRVVSREGCDVTLNFIKGSEATLRTAKESGASLACLKERSPSCGRNEIYDGSFSGMVIPGMGVCAELLEKNGVRVFSEEQLDELLKILSDM